MSQLSISVFGHKWKPYYNTKLYKVFFLEPTNCFEVYKITIISMADKYSVGFDGINSKILKETACDFRWVNLFINLISFEKSIFPSVLK